MNQGLGQLLAPPEAGQKQQRVPVIMIEALPGGYAITQHWGEGGFGSQRRSVVGNRDLLLGVVAAFARDAEARELAGDGNVGRAEP